MGQRGPVYADSPSLQLLSDWMAQHLPSLDEGARRRIIQLTAGIFETQSVLVDTIATSSAFQADAAVSNATQVRRILRDTRLTLETVYLPLVQQWLLAMQPQVIYLTMDESTHNRDYGLFEVGLATDGVSLPLGWTLFAYEAAWAEDARTLLTTLAGYLPPGCHVILLADRIHTGLPFLTCLDELGWDYIFRAKSDILIETDQGWKRFYARTLPHNTGRYFHQVRIWKEHQWRTNVSIYKHARPGFKPVIWFVVSSLPASKLRCREYACRWWQECTFRQLKSSLFHWERGRITALERVTVLLIGVGCAMWALWQVARAHEARRCPKGGPRVSVLKQGVVVTRQAAKRKQPLRLARPPLPRVLDYHRSLVLS